ncbi:PREDICTED: uncharacterized protein LOC109359436 isoform X1 [Lupinus angustifolius]|uniref:uncharacterized protein LOC109359436 isoform X1 n=1 Tax=Lupinus angustifolius TaxID=3871 RepID=UPI00092E4755|nr:PREDICTED: uncharacterized protein LOC109359436 isoform X1 [Lupinus angustifolius]XP_019459644.1 PREDICTED: uncharacterized protein LOC109359436 isoform X1 [Lupinus angustifolius]
MAQSLVYGVRVPELSRIVSSAKRVTRKQPRLPNHVAITAAPKSEPSKLKIESSECRVPLSQVVSDCTKRWFQDTLNEAKAGDSAMQLLLADMYFNGYGVPIDPQKGNAWINKASRSKKSVRKASDIHIGYRTSDSDSYKLEKEANFEG